MPKTHPTEALYAFVHVNPHALFDCDDVIYCQCGRRWDVNYDDNDVTMLENIAAHIAHCECCRRIVVVD